MNRIAIEMINHFVALPLRGVLREYPNSIQHLLNSEADIISPRAQHPVFFGSYDFHSCVHGYYLLAECARQYPGITQYDAVVNCFQQQFSAENFAAELAYFKADGRVNFSRPYGWGWLFRLDTALSQWDLPEATDWRQAMQPLIQYLRDALIAFLPKQTYPVRVGTHFNTAFSLIGAQEYALAQKDAGLLASIADAAMRYYGTDYAYPFRYEPGGDEFLSAGLCEALLMARVWSDVNGGQQFTDWFEQFLIASEQAALCQVAHVSDRSDPKIGHLDGLNLSKAWGLFALAKQLQREDLRLAGEAHLDASIEQVANGHYTGEHWLATFGYMALTEKVSLEKVQA